MTERHFGETLVSKVVLDPKLSPLKDLVLPKPFQASRKLSKTCFVRRKTTILWYLTWDYVLFRYQRTSYAFNCTLWRKNWKSGLGFLHGSLAQYVNCEKLKTGFPGSKKLIFWNVIEMCLLRGQKWLQVQS